MCKNGRRKVLGIEYQELGRRGEIVNLIFLQLKMILNEGPFG
jgi:hypothetical protein